MKKFASAGALALLFVGACNPDKTAKSLNIPQEKDLKAGGVYVAYNLGCEAGCDQIQKGDLIQKMDGTPVKSANDLKTIIDGQPHTLELLAKETMAPKQVQVTAKPKDNLPPLTEVPPFWLVSADKLNAAPAWARRRMFGHASPSVQLVSIDGGILDGRALYGKKRLMIYWDWGDRVDEANAVGFLQVLQKAQADLNAKGVEVMFIHVQFPTGRKAPMNDSDLRAWQAKWKVTDTPVQDLKLYRFPNATEYNQAREVGLEGAYTVFENLGESPAIIMLDENGIVRWHSEGVEQPPPGAEIQKPEIYTIIEAVKFGTDKL